MFVRLSCCCLILIQLTLVSSVYQRCTKLATNYILLDNSNATIVSFSANFGYIKLLSSSFDIIIINNITTFADYHDIDALQELDSYVDDVDDICSLDSGCQLFVDNSVLALFLNAQNETDIQNFLVFKGLIDEKSFSLDDGFIFSKEQYCHSQFKDASFGAENFGTSMYQSCCTSFDPPSSLPSTILPKCLEFQSRSTIYNTDDNYSIFATLKGEYSLTEDKLSIKTNYSGPDGSTYQLSANGLIHCNGNNTSAISECEFPLKNFNTKILFKIRMQYVDIAGSDSWEFEYISGRLIIFENETFMSEGKPFTVQNNCFYLSQNYSIPKVAQSQFCCSKFETV